MTILCATDFSQPATDALGVAVDLAKKRGDGLLLWHAVQPQPQFGDPRLPYIEPMLADCEARLVSEADRIRKTGLSVTTEVVVGWPDHELPARMPADTTLIVAGARGHTRGFSVPWPPMCCSAAAARCSSCPTRRCSEQRNALRRDPSPRRAPGLLTFSPSRCATCVLPHAGARHPSPLERGEGQRVG